MTALCVNQRMDSAHDLPFSKRTGSPLERRHYSANGHCSHAETTGCDGSPSADRIGQQSSNSCPWLIAETTVATVRRSSQMRPVQTRVRRQACMNSHPRSGRPKDFGKRPLAAYCIAHEMCGPMSVLQVIREVRSHALDSVGARSGVSTSYR